MKKGQSSLGNMVQKIASSIADEGQAALEVGLAEQDGPVPPPHAIRAYAGRSGAPAKAGSPATTRSGAEPSVAAAVTVTVQELKDFDLQKLHEASKPKSIEWALDQYGFDEDVDGIHMKDKFDSYDKALGALVKPTPIKGRGRAGPTPSAVLSAFKAHCNNMGIKFDERRLSDLVSLVSAIQARNVAQR